MDKNEDKSLKLADKGKKPSHMSLANFKADKILHKKHTDEKD